MCGGVKDLWARPCTKVTSLTFNNLCCRKHAAVLQNFSGRSQVVPDPFSSINPNEAALSGLLNRDTLPSHCGNAPKETFLLILLTVQKKNLTFIFLFFSSCGVYTNCALIEKVMLVTLFIIIIFLCHFTCMLCWLVFWGFFWE